MSDSFIPLLQFFVTTGEVVGRKKCQKMIHILQECGHDFGFDFKLALYGAYSSALQAQLEDFVNYEYITEQPAATEVAGYRTSTFSASDRGKTVLEKLKENREPSWKALAVFLNEQNTRDLEAASTILYLQKEDITDRELQEKFRRLKPHLVGIFDKGKALADRLRGGSRATA